MRGQRHRHGRGRGGRSAGTAISRFLEPCLLLLLNKGASYGYELVNALKPFGFDDVARGPVYRTLRELEAAQMIQSEWDTESSGGPARRVYQITEAGRSYLANWVESLRGTERMIRNFLATYDQYTGENRGKNPGERG